MNKIILFPKSTLRISKHNKRAVSDVVAVLILIVIAIIGAVAVGLILSTTSHSVGSQAANNGNGQSASSVLYIGGSTTVFPVTEALKTSFENTFHATIQDAQGGSDAGMQGVLSGALDVGAASSVGAVENLQNAIVSNSITGVTVNPTLIGGSAVVVIENGPSTHGLLQDDGATPNECQGITKQALDVIFEISGKFGIIGSACNSGTYFSGTVGAASTTTNIVAGTPASWVAAGAAVGETFTDTTLSESSTITAVTAGALTVAPALGTAPGTGDAFTVSGGDSTLDSATKTATTTICAATTQALNIAGVLTSLSVPACAGSTTDTGAVYAAYSRSDNSGTQDQFASFTGLPKQSAAGNYPGSTAVGNPGVLAAVQGDAHSIGFVDLGFAEGAPAGSVCPSGTGGTTGNLCGVAMPMVMSSAPAQAPLLASAQTLSGGVSFTLASGSVKTYDGYVPKNTGSGNVHNAIIAALKAAYFVNPLTGAGSKSYFPDTGAAGTGLARTFYYVVNGTPTPLEQEFLSFATNYNQEFAFTNNGYFSQYDITSA